MMLAAAIVYVAVVGALCRAAWREASRADAELARRRSQWGDRP